MQGGGETVLEQIARSTSGFSGAELANVVNEAAILAARCLFGWSLLLPVTLLALISDHPPRSCSHMVRTGVSF